MEVFQGGVGIDIGTKYCSVGIWRDEKVEIVSDKFGNTRIPSAILFSSQGIFFGQEAFDRYAESNIESDALVHSFTRLLGTDGSNNELKKDMEKFAGFSIVVYDCKVYVETLAEMQIRKSIEKAVFSIPQTCNDSQRQAMRDSVTIAGLECIRLMNSCAAIGMCYAYHQLKDREEKKILIVEIGGGFTNMAACVIEEGIVEVVSVSGARFAGIDFNQRILQHVSRKSNGSIFMSKNDHEKWKILEECENVKMKISKNIRNGSMNFQCDEKTDLVIDVENIGMIHSLTKLLNEQITELFRSASSGLFSLVTQAEEIILVGGSSTFAFVRDFFVNHHQINARFWNEVDSNEMNIFGTTIQSAILTPKPTKTGKRITDDLLMLDVLPYSVGIETAGGVMTKMIQRNSTIPCSKCQVFSTYSDNQPGVLLRLYEGDNEHVKDNRLVGKFEFKGFQLGPRGVPKIEVSFKIDGDCILTVCAKEQGSNNKEMEVVVERGGISKGEMEKMKKEMISMQKNINQTARDGFERRCFLIEMICEGENDCGFERMGLKIRMSQEIKVLKMFLLM